MSPSRGSGHAPPTTTRSSNTSSSSSSSSDEALIDAHSSSALTSTRRNLSYLLNPTRTSSSDHPSRLRTRLLLRTLHSLLSFLTWRLVRYAKYVAIGTLVATLGAGLVGSFASGVGFVLAPTGIVGTLVAAGVWGVGKFAARRVAMRYRRGKEKGSGYGDFEEEVERRRTVPVREAVGAEAQPW